MDSEAAFSLARTLTLGGIPVGIEHPRFKYFRPQYSDRDRDGLPREWIGRMKRAIRTLGWRFSADRMVMDYVLNAYIPAAGGTSSSVTRF